MMAIQAKCTNFEEEVADLKFANEILKSTNKLHSERVKQLDQEIEKTAMVKSSVQTQTEFQDYS